MNPIRHLGRLVALSAFSLSLTTLVGCEPAAAPTEAPAPAATPGDAAPTKIESLPVEKKEGAAADVKLSDEELAEIKKLPAAEQPIALAQKVCPVTDAHLGEMGVPIRQEVDGKVFFLCCGGCTGQVKSDPAGVLAKLPK